VTNDALQATFARMRAAHVREPTPTRAERARRLGALEALIADNRAAIAGAIAADFGRRPTEETDLLEVFPSLSGIRHARAHLRRWMRPRRGWAGFWFLPARIEIRPQPLGVVGIIVPWNYPLYLAAGPLTDALAAGNRVLLKMSELTPAFSTLLEELVEKYFGADVVDVVNGGADVARAFSALPFDHLLFTGSTAVGHEVMRTAAANLTPVTLELGGKSPAIIGADARFEHAVERIVLGKLLNAGQTCIAPDYVLLPRGRERDFIDIARAAVARFYPGLATNRQFAGIATERHHARLSALRDDVKTLVDEWKALRARNGGGTTEAARRGRVVHQSRLQFLPARRCGVRRPGPRRQSRRAGLPCQLLGLSWLAGHVELCRRDAAAI